MQRVAIYTGRKLGDYVLCREDNLIETVVSKCKKCDCHRGVVRQDPSNPFNYNWEVVCAYEERRREHV